MKWCAPRSVSRTKLEQAFVARSAMLHFLPGGAFQVTLEGAKRPDF
jgi:hypothetical protein